MSAYDIVWVQTLSATTGTVQPGYGVCLDPLGKVYVPATPAALAAAGGVLGGITSGANSANNGTPVQFSGPMDHSITGLGPGVAGPVGLDSSGRLARGGYPIVGSCNQYGDLVLSSSGGSSSGGNVLQATWHIDWATGLDTNDGLTYPGTPLKTVKEMLRRIGTQFTVSGLTVNVTIHSSVLAANGDLLHGAVRLDSGAALQFTGVPTVVGSSGTLSAVVANVAATNTPWSATGLGLSTQVGNLVQITSGANAGTTAWVLKDLGADNVRLSCPMTPGNGGTIGAFTNGDAFQVVILPRMDVGAFALSATQSEFLGVSQIAVSSNSSHALWEGAGSPGSSIILFDRCSLTNQTFFASSVSIGCIFLAGTNQFFGSSLNSTFGGAALNGKLFVSGGSTLKLHGNFGFFVQQNATIYCQYYGGLDLRGHFIFDTTIPAISLFSGAIAKITNHVVAGSGNSASIFSIDAGCWVTYRATLSSFPVVTSAPQSFDFQGITSGPTMDPATFALGAAQTYTFANLIAAIGASGFGGNASRPLQGCGFVTSLDV